MNNAGEASEKGNAISRPGIAVLLLTIVAVAARWQTFANPVIGFDEQFYLLVGDRLLHGMVPYVDIFDRKPIGLFLIYAGARLLGGAGFLAYKLFATGFVVATGWCLFRIARRWSTPFGALAAASLYIVWLDLMEGEGGQSPVFYDLLMIVAAGAVLRAIDDPRRLRMAGAAAMAAVGLALQIKYSVLIEGGLFGCVLLWQAWRRGDRGWAIVAPGLLWIACALAPTVVVLGCYAAIGHARDFLFANFTSVLGQVGRPFAEEMQGLAAILGILSPLAIGIVVGRPWRRVPAACRPGYRFVALWLAGAVASVLLYGRFDSPHYAMPILLPATLVLAPVLGAGRRRWVIAFVAGIFLAGQVVLALTERTKGGRAAAEAVAAAAAPGNGCLFVYDGYPALYMLTRSCLPTKWAFPGHLNTQDEAGRAALGTDPSVETRRILATRPTAIVDDFPRFKFGNRATRAILATALARDYHLAACIPTGGTRVRLVYRLGTGAVPAACPPARALAVLP